MALTARVSGSYGVILAIRNGAQIGVFSTSPRADKHAFTEITDVLALYRGQRFSLACNCWLSGFVQAAGLPATRDVTARHISVGALLLHTPGTPVTWAADVLAKRGNVPLGPTGLLLA
jgi:hypothetical protein